MNVNKDIPRGVGGIMIGVNFIGENLNEIGDQMVDALSNPDTITPKLIEWWLSEIRYMQTIINLQDE